MEEEAPSGMNGGCNMNNVDAARGSRVRMNAAKTIAIQCVILLVGLACMELFFREFLPMPVHGGVYLDREGHSVRVASSQWVLRPNLDITHQASEFSKRIRTNSLGYRWVDNASLTPEYLFLGDSFTFGHGVSDEETFVALFCAKNKIQCQNLGRSGADTFDETGILHYAIEHYRMRPANVVVVMLAACWLDAAGNDLGDNLRHVSKGAAMLRGGGRRVIALAADLNLPGGVVRMLDRWFGSLEITKRVMAIFSQRIKGALYRCSDEREMDAAIGATKTALDGLQRLATEYRFNVKLVVIHPYQELDGHFAATEQAVRRATPAAFDLIVTGADFRKDDYYPYDGHFNAKGHRTLASILERRLPVVASEHR